MTPADDQRDKFLAPLFEAAENGDRRAARFLAKLAANQIEKGSSLAPRLRKFFSGILKNPALYAEIMTAEPKKLRGRPSIDRGSTAEVVGLGHFKVFGSRQTESNALAIYHLLSQGHTLNEAGSVEKDSAVVIVSELTRRSPRSLQTDYARHKEAILQMGPERAHESARIAYQRLLSLAELRRIHNP